MIHFKVLLLIIIFLAISSAASYAFIFKNKKLELKKAKYRKALIENYRHFYFKTKLFYSPPENTKGSVDFLE